MAVPGGSAIYFVHYTEAAQMHALIHPCKDLKISRFDSRVSDANLGRSTRTQRGEQVDVGAVAPFIATICVVRFWQRTSHPETNFTTPPTRTSTAATTTRATWVLLVCRRFINVVSSCRRSLVRIKAFPASRSYRIFDSAHASSETEHVTVESALY